MKRVLIIVSALNFFVAACNKKSSSLPPDITGFEPSKGGIGYSVGIRGRNFGNNPGEISVAFNGTRATVLYVSDTLVVASVPPGASTGKISVSVNGQLAASGGTFTVLDGKWTQKANLPLTLGRALGLGFSISGKGYFGAGYDGGSGNSDLYEYDPALNQWTQKSSIPGNPGFYNAIQMVIGNKAYVGVGQSASGPLTVQFWEYDPASDLWTRKADFPGTARKGSIGFGAGNKGYLGFGDIGNGTALKDWWQYDPSTDQWAQLPDFPGNIRSWPAGFVLNGMIYVGLSFTPSYKDWWQYDPGSGTWTQKASFPGSDIFAASGFSLGSYGYVAGGGSECWQYDPVSNQWNEKSFFANRRGVVAFSIGSKGYVCTGVPQAGPNSFPQKDLWEFDPGP